MEELSGRHEAGAATRAVTTARRWMEGNGEGRGGAAGGGAVCLGEGDGRIQQDCRFGLPEEGCPEDPKTFDLKNGRAGLP